MSFAQFFAGRLLVFGPGYGRSPEVKRLQGGSVIVIARFKPFQPQLCQESATPQPGGRGYYQGFLLQLLSQLFSDYRHKITAEQGFSGYFRTKGIDSGQPFFSNLRPLVVSFLVYRCGNLFPPGIEYRAYRQACFGVLVGFCFQGADADNRDIQAEGEPLGGADADP